MRLVAVLILQCFCIWPREVKCGVEEGRSRGRKKYSVADCCGVTVRLMICSSPGKLFACLQADPSKRDALLVTPGRLEGCYGEAVETPPQSVGFAPVGVAGERACQRYMSRRRYSRKDELRQKTNRFWWLMGLCRVYWRQKEAVVRWAMTKVRRDSG
ncbi:hypothetical protein GGR53DRAFT_438337 [Hypoxylon sp. FL1150]|nr:hypothetical protein GGR53DRAFT_438337 [Hypoxylon sp. FL1150]